MNLFRIISKKSTATVLNIRSISKVIISGIFCYSGVAFSMDFDPSYNPLPLYGTVSFNLPSCMIARGTTPAITWGATPSGYGYPAVQYGCSGSYKVLLTSGTNAGYSCDGGFSAISTPPASMITDGAGNLNPANIATNFFSANINNNCTGDGFKTAGANAAVTIKISCALSNGGALDVPITGVSASCSVL